MSIDGSFDVLKTIQTFGFALASKPRKYTIVLLYERVENSVQ